jgi:hypothetical protein
MWSYPNAPRLLVPVRDVGGSHLRPMRSIVGGRDDDRAATLGRLGYRGATYRTWSAPAPPRAPRSPLVVLGAHATHGCRPSGRSIRTRLPRVSGLWTSVARLADAVERLAACVGSGSLGAAVLEPRDYQCPSVKSALPVLEPRTSLPQPMQDRLLADRPPQRCRVGLAGWAGRLSGIQTSRLAGRCRGTT